MPNYEVTLQRTTGASTTNSAASIVAQTALLRRFKVYSMTFSSEATPAEVAILWQVGRIITAGTATAVVAKPKDFADAAASALCQQIHTSTEPSYTTGENMYTNAVHQRATVRWIARDDQDMIVCPQTNNSGLGFKTPTLNGGTPNITLDLGFIE